MAKIQVQAMASEERYIDHKDVLRIIAYYENLAEKHYNNGHMKWYIARTKFATCLNIIYIMARRVSEVVGNPKCKHRCPGLRPIDINFETGKARFFILKKNSNRTRTKDLKKLKKKFSGDELKLAQKAYEKKKDVEKAAKTVYFYLPQHILEQLKWIIETQNLNPNERIFPYRREWLTIAISRACEKLNIYLRESYEQEVKDEEGNVISKILLPKKVSVHNLRHAAGVQFISKHNNSSAALLALKKLMQHSSINVTQSYATVKDKEQLKMIEQAFMDEKDEL